MQRIVEQGLPDCLNRGQLAALVMSQGRRLHAMSAHPPPVPRARYAGDYPLPVAARPRVDLAQLDRQLDQLSHRIQRMEGIVTDRQFDWERRMEG